jgi:hypothetical protein
MELEIMLGIVMTVLIGTTTGCALWFARDRDRP